MPPLSCCKVSFSCAVFPIVLYLQVEKEILRGPFGVCHMNKKVCLKLSRILSNKIILIHYKTQISTDISTLYSPIFNLKCVAITLIEVHLYI